MWVPYLNWHLLEWETAACSKILAYPMDRGAWWATIHGAIPGASMRNSTHGKGHEEQGLAYTKAWSSLRKPPVPEHLTQKPESVLCSHLHLWLYGGLSPITISLGEGVNVQLQGNKNSWAWQECFNLRTLEVLSSGCMWLFIASQLWEAQDVLKLSKYRLFWEVRRSLV